MSVVWASGGGSEWGSSRPLRNAVRNNPSDREGTYGEPSSFVDVGDPRIARPIAAEREARRKAFVENRGLVKEMIQRGVVYPTSGMLERVVSEMRRIAGK